MKSAVAKAVHAFQLTEEYYAILFGWYFKGIRAIEKIPGEAQSRDIGGPGF